MTVAKNAIVEFLKAQSKSNVQKIHFAKPERPVHTVFIHCSASEKTIDDSFARLKYLHTQPKSEKIKWGNYGLISCKGFYDVGYQFVITKDGVIHKGRSLEKRPSSQAPHNTGSIAICVCGLKDFTQKSLLSLVDLCTEIHCAYDDIRFRGHCEVSNRTCPVFNYKDVLNLDGRGRMMIV